MKVVERGPVVIFCNIQMILSTCFQQHFSLLPQNRQQINHSSFKDLECNQSPYIKKPFCRHSFSQKTSLNATCGDHAQIPTFPDKWPHGSTLLLSPPQGPEVQLVPEFLPCFSRRAAAAAAAAWYQRGVSGQSGHLTGLLRCISFMFESSDTRAVRGLGLIDWGILLFHLVCFTLTLHHSTPTLSSSHSVFHF